MTLALLLAQRHSAAPNFPDDPWFCRQRMALWLDRCRQHRRGGRDQAELAKMALVNARTWRDRAAWALEER